MDGVGVVQAWRHGGGWAAVVWPRWPGSRSHPYQKLPCASRVFIVPSFPFPFSGLSPWACMEAPPSRLRSVDSVGSCRNVPTGTWSPCATLALAPCSFRSSRAYSDWIVPIAAHTPRTHSSKAATEEMRRDTPPIRAEVLLRSHSCRPVARRKGWIDGLIPITLPTVRLATPPRPSSLRGW